MRSFSILALLIFVASCSRPAPPVEPDPSTQIRLDGLGQAIGFVSPEGAHVWRGLPYAAPPVGDLRWRAPRPAEGWAGERIATEHGPACAQIANTLSAGDELEPGMLIGSEDCLTIDVYAPPDSENLPVMVWIHGGSNIWGQASQYSGAQLAMDQSVIVMVVQYRLGPLGFLSSQVLRDSAQTPEDEAANFAILDLVEALHWVRQHASAFGGNSANVTIFGESAGGHNVAGLLASPLASDLFDRAIIQSGSLMTVTADDAEGRGVEEDNASDQVLPRITGGPVTADALRSAELADIYAAYGPTETGYYELPRMIEDGVAVPAGGIRMALESPETFNAVPVMTGTNRDEMRLFNALDPEISTRTMGLFYRPRDKDYFSTLSDYQSAMWTIGAVDDPAALMVAGGHDDVWAYRFDWDEGGSNLFIDTRFMLGAAHGMEIPFVFNHFDLFGVLDSVLFNGRNEDGRTRLAHQMGQYWTDFARHGDPGGDWQSWGMTGQRMRFDSAQGGGPEMIEGRGSVANLAQALASDARVDDDERCRIALAMQDRFFGDGASIHSRLNCPSED
jgi:para-nitrobenzyl esterase